jgi:hypothetical protein
MPRVKKDMVRSKKLVEFSLVSPHQIVTRPGKHTKKYGTSPSFMGK